MFWPDELLFLTVIPDKRGQNAVFSWVLAASIKKGAKTDAGDRKEGRVS
jgi:hypothetical protein